MITQPQTLSILLTIKHRTSIHYDRLIQSYHKTHVFFVCDRNDKPCQVLLKFRHLIKKGELITTHICSIYYDHTYKTKGQFTWGVLNPKSHSCQQVPIVEPQETIIIRLIFIKVKSWLSYAKKLKRCVEDFGLTFCSTQLSAQVPNLTFKKRCHVGIHVIIKT